MNEQVNYAKIQRIQDNLEALTIGTFGTGFVTDAMMYESGIKATVAQHTSDLAEKENKTKYYSPEDYGALGDGTTDDSVAFLNMLNAISADSNTFNRSIKLTKKYYLSQPITMMDRLQFFCDNTNQSIAELIFANNLTSCFVEPTSTIVAGRLWNFELIHIKISSNSPILKGGTLQFWQFKMKKCVINSKIAFDSMLLYLSEIRDNQFTCATFTSQTRIIDSWVNDNVFNFTTTYGTGSGIFMDIKDSSTTKISQNYFTIGAITSYSGTYLGVKLFNCTTCIFEGNVFDCSNGSYFDVGNSSKYISIVNNIFRGWGSMANYNSATLYKSTSAFILGNCSHVIISQNSFSKFTASGIFPGLTNKAHYCIDTQTPTSLNINNNMYEGGLIYFDGVQTYSQINEPCYTPTVYSIPV